MDSDGLPIVGPGLDLTKVGAINQKRILAFLNHYLTNTVQYLNRFSCVCEEKLTDLTIKIQRLETTMNILEAKLSSIPGLDIVTVSTASDNTTSANAAAEQSTSNDQPTNQQTPAQTNTAQMEIEETQPAQPQMTVSQHPKYAQYFKMINLGVPEMAIKQKMAMEGLDPDILDSPNASVASDDMPSNKMAKHKSDDSSDDFSDEEKSGSSEDEESDAFSDE